jgi:hypothetical protein
MDAKEQVRPTIFQLSFDELLAGPRLSA